MLKLIRNGIMKRFVLAMAAVVSESPATCDQLPLSSCSPPFFGWFPQTNLDGCSLLDTFVLRFSPLLSPPSPPPLIPIPLGCCNLNFLSSYQVWSDFSFCPKGVLEWLQAMWSEPGIYVQSWACYPARLPCHHCHSATEFLWWTPQSLLVTWSP